MSDSDKLWLTGTEWEVNENKCGYVKIIANTHDGIRFDVTDIADSGLLQLMIKHNLTFKLVYNIVKESIEE